MNFFIDNWDKIGMILVGFIAIFVYNMQKMDEKRSAAILIIIQIDDLKRRLSSIIELINNNKIDSAGIYETLDFLENNQWDKYKHLFVKNIDVTSLKIIDSFFESVSIIREQLIVSKRLQQQSFFNNQQNIGQALSMYLMQLVDFQKNKDFIINRIRDSENKKDDTPSIQGENRDDYDKILNNYLERRNKLLQIYKQDGIFISYIPEQVRVTIEKELTKLSHIEIIGCLGYKKIKKIAKIK